MYSTGWIFCKFNLSCYYLDDNKIKGHISLYFLIKTFYYKRYFIISDLIISAKKLHC